MNEETAAAILDAADEGVIVFEGGRCVRAGRRMGAIFGVERVALLGASEQKVSEELCAASDDPDTLRDLLRQSALAEVPPTEVELARPTRRIVRWRSMRLPTGWIGLARDVTRERSAERRAAQLLARLEQITATDALTQLPNFRRFVEELEREHMRSARAAKSYAVLRIDIDGLSMLNDELGRPHGDEVLEQVADRLREVRREYDILARLGDDEFVLLIPGADAKGTQIVAERMAGAVTRAPLSVAGGRDVSVTIGAAVWPPSSSERCVDVLERARAALSRAKKRGARELEIDNTTKTR